MPFHRPMHAIAAYALVALCACGSEEPSRGPLPADDFPEELAEITPLGGFLNGRRAEFYRMGEVTVRENRDGDPADTLVHPLYVFGRDRAPLATADAEDAAPYAIIDSIPGQDDYTGFWEIHRVQVGSGFSGDIKSRAALLREGLEIVPTGEIVNCPVIPQDARIEAPSVGAKTKRPVLLLWYRRYETRCLLLDGGAALLARGAPRFAAVTVQVGKRKFPSVPLHEVFVPRLSLFDQEVDVPSSIIASAELGEDSPYSPVVRVFDVAVPPDYAFCAFAALDEVDASLITIRDPLTFWNLSMLGVDEAAGCPE